MKLTTEQSAAAFARDKNIAVIAGAGTGKTRVLTERYLDLVLQRDVEIPRVLALTFTEKAAREMKERIRETLRERGRLAEARKVEFAPISTIHAFLARTLRERALDAGLDPRFTVADEMTAQLHLEASLERAVDGLDPKTREDLSRVSGGEDDVFSIYLALRATPLGIDDLSFVRQDKEELRIRMRRFLDGCHGKAPGKTAERLSRLSREGFAFGNLDPARADDFDECVKGRVANAFRDHFLEGKAIAKLYLSLRHEPLAEAVGAAMVDVLRGLDAHYTRAKRAEGLVDFADLERLGMRLLESPVGAEIAGAFDHLLVDEYQDTSRIQEAILERLAAGSERFGVGDEKQSIYRFRYADVAVFRTLQDKATRFSLSGSFRTRPEIMRFLNRTFADLFSGTRVQSQDLRATASWNERDGVPVEVIAPEGSSLADGRRKEARTLARRLRQIVEEKEVRLTRAGREGMIEYRHCALLLRTMTHLSLYERALSNAGVPYVVVKGRGYYAAREVVDLAHLLLLLGDPLDEFRATAALTSLFCGATDGDVVHLRALGQRPSADTRAAKARDADETTHGRGGGRAALRNVPWSLRALHAERPDAIPTERWERLVLFARRFQRWQTLLGRIETGDLVETILHETRFAELCLIERDGRRRHANLQKALRRAREFPDDPVAYARSLLDFREREFRESEAALASESDQAVRIMTVHAAKGLEWPLVAVADLTARSRSIGGPILMPDGEFGVRLKVDGEPKSVKPPGFEALNDLNKDLEREEALRLLYVALTRAEEHLILSGAVIPAKKKGTTLVHAVLDESPDDVAQIDCGPLLSPDSRRRQGAAIRAAVRRRADLPAELPRADEDADALLARLDALEPPVPDNTPYVAAVADLVEFTRCPRRYRLKRMYGIEWDPDPAADSSSLATSVRNAEDFEADEPANAEEHPRRALGTAFHEIMEEVGPWTIPDEATIRRYLPDATGGRADADRKGEVALMTRWSEWLTAQPFTAGLEQADPQREMAFLTRIAGLPVRGVIDLYAPGVPMVLDYKTGKNPRPSQYAVQVSVYVAALRQLGLPAPDRAHLVYVDAEQTCEVPAEPVDDLIHSFITAHRGAGDFPPQPGEACQHCEFKKACERNGVHCP